MGAIITVEHTSGGEPAYCCRDTVQTMRSVNLKVEREPGGSENTWRYRLCDRCSGRLLEDLSQALRRPLERL